MTALRRICKEFCDIQRLPISRGIRVALRSESDVQCWWVRLFHADTAPPALAAQWRCDPVAEGFPLCEFLLEFPTEFPAAAPRPRSVVCWWNPRGASTPVASPSSPMSAGADLVASVFSSTWTPGSSVHCLLRVTQFALMEQLFNGPLALWPCSNNTECSAVEMDVDDRLLKPKHEPNIACTSQVNPDLRQCSPEPLERPWKRRRNSFVWQPRQGSCLA
eukprot:TRINITY_DN82470_c0_g1_i1.p1 TRINITY_DN82470_c0_g1~~TRINITY_DN82470_c0_g1_i1.p1  ORF type:complete len:241 (-),score=11.06 TRINITY_DN82470_c0_g1_i1:61-717(-)